MISPTFQKLKISEPVSIVAHQLKNPLAVLKGYVEVLLSEDFGKINEKQKEYLADALENVQRMARIVADILDVSRIEQKKYEIHAQSVDLVEMARETIDYFSAWSKASNCEITFSPAFPLPSVFADPLKIRQVIENLVSNAILYKSSGRGKILISLVKKAKNAVFMCSDNGMGIPKEDLKKIFSKFYRSEEALEKYPSGTGLGLYISRAIIELSGGKIWFEKNRDSGMTFFFSLPVVR